MVKRKILEALDYRYSGKSMSGLKRDIEVEIVQPEFTSLCPRTGLPDFGKITIRYVPDKKIVELKSLKYYLLQYRDTGIFYEKLVNKILDDLVVSIKPVKMEITGEFSPRGGILTKVSAKYIKK